MNQDIRIAVSFKGHRKRKKLCRLLGFGSEIYLIDLWLTVAMDCPEGVLAGWDEEDIADACDWAGEPKELVDALIESNWLEKDADGEYQLHDWCEHQGWACNARTRSETASKNILFRWTLKEIEKEKAPEFKKWFGSEYAYQKGHTTVEVLSLYQSYTDSINSNTNGNTPYPLPSPYPSPIINITRGKSVFDLFSPVINGWDKSKLEQTMDGFISTRKTGLISSGVIQKEFDYWRQYPTETVNAALTAYVDGKHWESGKNEKYLRGIIRGKDKAIQKESSQSLFEKAF